jgi:hypothetical protein
MIAVKSCLHMYISGSYLLFQKQRFSRIFFEHNPIISTIYYLAGNLNKKAFIHGLNNDIFNVYNKHARMF